MAFNPDIKRKIVRDRKTDEHLPCVMRGKTCPLPDAVHIIDAKEWRKKLGCDKQCNGKQPQELRLCSLLDTNH